MITNKYEALTTALYQANIEPDKEQSKNLTNYARQLAADFNSVTIERAKKEAEKKAGLI